MRRDPYLCSAKAPVLEGSGSRRIYSRKGTSVDRVYVVFGARVYLGFFYYPSKRIRGGVAFAEGNSSALKQRHSSYEYPHCVSATRRLALDNRPIQSNSPNTHTHTRCTLSCTAADRQGGREAGKKRWGIEGWREGRAEVDKGG